MSTYLRIIMRLACLFAIFLLLAGCDPMYRGVVSVEPPPMGHPFRKAQVIETLDRIAKAHGLAIGFPASRPRIPGCEEGAVRCYDYDWPVDVPQERGSWRTIVVYPCETARCVYVLVFSDFPAGSESEKFREFRAAAERALGRDGFSTATGGPLEEGFQKHF